MKTAKYKGNATYNLCGINVIIDNDFIQRIHHKHITIILK